MKEYDVVISGAGPAGCTTAYSILKNNGNLEVLVIDRRISVGHPYQCAGGLAKHMTRRLPFKVPRKVIKNRIKGFCIVGPNESACLKRKDTIGYILDREKFDQYIADLAEKKGAEIHTRETFKGYYISPEPSKEYVVSTVHAGKRKLYKCNTIVKADGPNLSLLSEKDTHIGVQYTIENDDFDHRYVYIFLDTRYAPEGYTWIFPEGKGVLRIGNGIPMDVNELTSAKLYLEKFLSDYDIEGKIINRTGGIIPTGIPRPYSKYGCIPQVGDAGNWCDPLTGAGIPNACYTGNILGEIIAEKRDPMWVCNEFTRRTKELSNELFLRYLVKSAFIKFNNDDFDVLVREIREFLEENKDTDINEAQEKIHGFIKRFLLRHPKYLLKFIF